MFAAHRWKLISLLLVKIDKIMVIQKRYLVSHKLLSEVSKIIKRLLFVKPRFVQMAEDLVPEETKRLGFNMCKDSIGGVWSEITEEDFQIKKLRYAIHYVDNAHHCFHIFLDLSAYYRRTPTAVCVARSVRGCPMMLNYKQLPTGS